MARATAQQLQIIREILEGKIHYSQSVLNLIDTAAVTGTRLAAGGAVLGGVAGLKAAGVGTGVVGQQVLGAAGLPLIGGFGIAGAACGGIVVSAIIGIAYAAYYTKGVLADRKRWYMEVDSVGYDAINTMWVRFFKDDIKNQRDTFIERYCGNREHEAFRAWMKLEDLYLTPIDERDEEYSAEESEYREMIARYIKPEYINNGEFERHMRLYCAANKILKDGDKGGSGFHLKTPGYEYAGEFKRSKPGYNSQGWKEREALKLQLQGLMNPGFLKKYWNFRDDINSGIASLMDYNYFVLTGKNNEQYKQLAKISTRTAAFEAVRDKFYQTYKAMTYAFYQGIDLDQIQKEIIDPWEKFLGDVVSNDLVPGLEDRKITKKDLFLSIFRRYRWLGGACEFDAEELMKMKLFHSFYMQILGNNQQERANSSGRYALYLAKVALITAGTTIVVGGAIGLYNGLNILHAQEIAAQNALIDQVHQNFQELLQNGASIEQLREVGGLADLAQAGDAVAQQKLNAVRALLENAKISNMHYPIHPEDGYECFVQNVNFVRDATVNPNANILLRSYTQLPANQINPEYFFNLGDAKCGPTLHDQLIEIIVG